MAVSPPPITASGFRLNSGAAPSHTAHALMPLFQKPLTSPEPGKSSRRATAPARRAQTTPKTLATAGACILEQ